MTLPEAVIKRLASCELLASQPPEEDALRPLPPRICGAFSCHGQEDEVSPKPNQARLYNKGHRWGPRSREGGPSRCSSHVCARVRVARPRIAQPTPCSLSPLCAHSALTFYVLARMLYHLAFSTGSLA
jgi:hypothetical protein